MRRHLSVCLMLVCVSLCAGSVAQAGYVKKWIWSKKEEKNLDKLEEEVKNEEGWFVLETDHWITKTMIDKRFTAEMALYMEIFYDVFCEAFEFKKEFAVKEKQKVLVFGSREGYAAHGGIPGSRGYYSPGDYEICTYMEDERLLSFSNCYHPVIQHEGTHALFHRLMGQKPIPVWLNEGMATFYEYWDYRSDASPTGNKSKDKKARRMRLTLSERKSGLRDRVRDNGGEYPRLGYVMGLISHRDWNVDSMGPTTRFHYGAAESVADFLLSDKKGRKLLEKMFERMDKSEIERDEEGYGRLTDPIVTEEEIEDFEDDWFKFLQKTWGINGKKPKD